MITIKNKKIGIGLMGLVALAIILFVGVQFNKAAYTFKLDVNPSIEIVSTKLDKVLQVNPLNDDAKEMLKDFRIKDKDLEDTIEDLADLMVLSGYISGGKDNIVMITVDDKTKDSKIVDKLNQAIKAYLENKQIEATILNQSISKELDNNNTGSELLAKKLHGLDDILSYDDLENMTIKELFELAEARNIDPSKLFSNILALDDLKDSNDEVSNAREYIGDDKAKEIALEIVNGQIIKFELDDFDDDNPEYEIDIISNGFKYEIELDAYTGKLVSYDKDKIDDDKLDKLTSETTSRISIEEAQSIALEKTGGGTIVKFKLDDDEYEVEIINGTTEYELEINAYTGKIIKFEKDYDGDYKDSPSIETTAATESKTTAPKATTASKSISADQAKKIALDKTGGGTIVDFELDDGKYEIEIENGNKEYEIEISASTGKIIKFEMDYDD